MKQDIPKWDGTIRFDTDCIVNGVPVKAGTVLTFPLAPYRWNPHTSQMEPFRYDDDQKGRW